MKRFVFALIVATLLFSGCGMEKKTDEVKPVESQESIDTTNAQNDFTFNLLSRLYGDDYYQNVAISGVSAHIALCLTANGAVGSVKDEIQSALGLEGIDMKAVNEHNKKFIDKKYADDIDLVVSNSLWVNKDTKMVDDFLKMAADYYKASVEKTDFSDEKAANAVNEWISKSTNGKISKMVTPEELSDAMLLLLNALYLKAPWTNQFDKLATTDQDFTLLNGSKKKVKMMSREGFYKYHKGEGFQIVRMPYGKNEELAMYVVLPESDDGLVTLANFFTQKELDVEIAKMKDLLLDLNIPKFKFEYETNLIPTLKKLGMNACFDPTTSSFSDMIQPPPEAYISLIKHKVFMDVHEAGTEAAAATSVEFIAGAAPGEESGPPKFLVDHPFMFIIRDEVSGEIMFASCVSVP